jgi:nucleoid-associated protein YgaU
MAESINPRTIRQNLDTAIEGTPAQKLVAALPQAIEERLMNALASMANVQRDEMFDRLMRITPDSAQGVFDSIIGAGSAKGSTYIVQRGDSLSRIAKAHGLTLDAVIKANPQIKNPDLIHPNDKITLPNAAS